MAARLLAEQAEAEAPGQDGGPPAKRRRAGDVSVNPLADDRFKAMFEDPAFVIDERSDEYKVLHPNAAKVYVYADAGALQYAWGVLKWSICMMNPNQMAAPS